MTHVNKISYVFTIGRVAEMLGEDKDWLFGVAEGMDTEDGQLLGLNGARRDISRSTYADLGNISERTSS